MSSDIIKRAPCRAFKISIAEDKQTNPILGCRCVSPTATASTCVEESSLCLTYPDYPVHIPTTTLPRRLSCNGGNNSLAGKRKKLTKKSKRDRGKKSSSSTSSSITSGEEAGPPKKSQGRTDLRGGRDRGICQPHTQFLAALHPLPFLCAARHHDGDDDGPGLETLYDAPNFK